MASIHPNIKDGKAVSYKFKLCLGRNKKGKQVFRCSTWTPPEHLSGSRLKTAADKAAKQWERTVIARYEAELEKLKPQNILFSDFVDKVWLPEQMSATDHRPSTIAFHTYLLKVIKPYFAGKTLSVITSSSIESYLRYLRNDYKTKCGGSLSPKTVRHHYCTLNLIFEYAVKTDYLNANPLSKIEIPKLQRHPVDALSNDDAQILIGKLNKLPLRLRLVYYLLLTVGLRRGECIGLQWRDLDLKNGLAHIERSVTYTALKGISVNRPKTDAGIRTIPLASKLVELLKEFQAEEQSTGELKPESFLFHSPDNRAEPHEPTYYTKNLKKFMKQSGLPDMSPHDLRHTCASLMLQSGADVKSVQDLLGHADASTTLNFYARSDIERIRESTERAFNL